jgi:uncharacterized protein YecE (DUF72 family)
LTDVLIGAGGWAYFHVPGVRSLEAYAHIFNFVEVNSSFYTIPERQLVRAWRKRVPSNFVFTVRCNKKVTHKYRLEPSEESYAIFKDMSEICRLLETRFLVLQTPSTIKYTHAKIKRIRDFFESVDRTGLKIVWEIRRRSGQPVPPHLVNVMQDYNITHCVDLSKEEPTIKSDVLYSRLFGKGYHNIYQFLDEELHKINSQITERNPETAILSFHNVKMYKDAVRYKIYHQTNKFVSVTRAKGQQSLKEVLREDAEFPMTKSDLIKDQGWKIVDLTEDKRVHAYQLLEQLPDREFQSIKDVLKNIF